MYYIQIMEIIRKTFNYVAKMLYKGASLLGITYNEINIIDSGISIENIPENIKNKLNID